MNLTDGGAPTNVHICECREAPLLYSRPLACSPLISSVTSAGMESCIRPWIQRCWQTDSVAFNAWTECVDCGHFACNHVWYVPRRGPRLLESSSFYHRVASWSTCWVWKAAYKQNNHVFVYQVFLALLGVHILHLKAPRISCVRHDSTLPSAPTCMNTSTDLSNSQKWLPNFNIHLQGKSARTRSYQDFSPLFSHVI